MEHRRVFFAPSFHQRFSHLGTAPSKLTGEGEVSAMASIRETGRTVEIVEVEKGAVVDVIQVTVLRRVILVTRVSSCVHVGQRVYVVLAIGWIDRYRTEYPFPSRTRNFHQTCPSFR